MATKMSEADEIVLRERRGPVELLTLNRPKVLNALSSSVLGALRGAIESVRDDGSVRALVLTGAGRAFAAGADIAEMRQHSPQDAVRFSRLGHEVGQAVEALPFPTIAAVNGFALGGGCELACACDWIYASTEARFGQPEVNLGLIPGFGGTSRLVRRVGVAWGKELSCTGEPIDAETALRIGLANRIFQPDELVPAAVAMGEKVAAKGPLAVELAKRLIQEGHGADVRVAHVLEQQAFGALASTQDRNEGMDAFLEKRGAKFRRS